MPPRVPVFHCLRAQGVPQCPSPSRAFSSTASSQASAKAQRRRHRDPYALAQANARKAANLSRQEVLVKERAAVLGDPVRGTTTPFVRSFDTALPPEPSPSLTSTHGQGDRSLSSDAGSLSTDTDNHLNFYLSKEELQSGIQRSKWLVQPLSSTKQKKEQAASPIEEAQQDTTYNSQQRQNSNTDMDSATFLDIQNLLQDVPSGGSASPPQANNLNDFISSTTPEAKEQRLHEAHETAQEAIRRISSLSLGSSKDRQRVNTQRCVDVFGRHNTDSSLAPKLQSVQTIQNSDKCPRIGPDTGSSEVQIAILTAKIRALADGLELRGGSDKVNKRNLRLLVHRRAKLLKYLRRKERGGPRWQNLIETLGLTEGTWKGEISL